jgi:hypothetical protein
MPENMVHKITINGGLTHRAILASRQTYNAAYFAFFFNFYLLVIIINNSYWLSANELKE